MSVAKTGILAVTLLLALITACGKTSGVEQQKIEEVLAIRAEALNSRDLPRYLSVISLHYNDKGKDFRQLQNNLKADFSQYDALSFAAEKPVINIDKSIAVATSRYRMKVVVRGRELEFGGTDNLKLAKEPEGWKIIAGI